MAIIREADREPVSAVSKRHGASEQEFYTWRKRLGGFEANDVRRWRQLEAENARLKKLVAERDLEIEMIKEVALKMYGPARRLQGLWFSTANGQQLKCLTVTDEFTK